MKKLRIALAGNSNVGKSALFNYLTGLHQHISNWPGKTIERAEGTFRFEDYEIDVIDLPGIYSLSTYSIEEQIAREFIVNEKPDVVINVVDSNSLERNLFLTLQLMELGAPLAIALNQIDIARQRGLHISERKLANLLGVPVASTVAITGAGVWELVKLCIKVAKEGRGAAPIAYGREIEKPIGKLSAMLAKANLAYPARYAAIKLLENDPEIRKAIAEKMPKAIAAAASYSKAISRIHGEQPSIAISNERYNIASRITSQVQKISPPRRMDFAEFIDKLTTHRFFGYLIMLLVLGTIFYSIFTFGALLSTSIGNFFNQFRPSGGLESLLWEGVVGGFVAGLTLVLPYVLPFYLLLSLLEDSGYITRIAYLMDSIMHRMGLHGKAIIPLILGYGCNVPACFACRILEHGRDRLIAAFAITLVPCTARTVVILALVGAYMGVEWALAIYLLDLFIVLALSRIAFKILPGEPSGLIMEMPRYRLPSLHAILSNTWHRTKSLLTIVFPYYIIGGLALVLLQILGIAGAINQLLVPMTVGWLMLPPFAGTLLLFGIVRKEFVVVLPALIFGTTDFSTLFTPLQMVILTIVTMLYIPCLATFAALAKEFGRKTALGITIFEILFAFLIGGAIGRLLLFSGLLT